MAIVENGVPLQISPGEWVGAEDFSDTPVGPGFPAGFTKYIDNEELQNYRVENDANPEVGNYLAADSTGFGNQIGIGRDSFDGLVQENVEMVTLTRNAGSRDNRKSFGPANTLRGAGATYNMRGWELNWVDDVPDQARGIILQNQNGTAGSQNPAAVTLSPGTNLPQGSWIWIRYRRNVKPSDNTIYEIKAKMWDGDFADEPAAWQVQYELTRLSGPQPEPGDAVGWMLEAISWDFIDHGMAFMSFTTDPLNNPPPEPGEVVPPGSLNPAVETVFRDFLLASDAVVDCVDTRVYQDRAPQNATYPLISIRKIDSDGTHGHYYLPNHALTRYRTTSQTKTFAKLVELRAALKGLDGFSLAIANAEGADTSFNQPGMEIQSAMSVFEQDQWEEESQLFTLIMDFEIFHTESFTPGIT